MKTIIAYALLVFWIPNIAGLFASAIIQLPITRVWELEAEYVGPTKSLFWQTLEAAGGFVAVLVALYIFKRLSVQITFVIPLIVATWTTVYYFYFRQPKWEWVCWLVGILLGWLLVAPVFLR